MKKLLLSLIILFNLTSLQAQNHPATDAVTAKFVGYFNAGETDNIYALFAEETKHAAAPAAIAGAVVQLKGALGNLVKTEYFDNQKNITRYIVTFERSGPVLYINYNTDNKIVGFFVDVDKRTPVDAPGGITVNSLSATLKGTLSIPDAAGKVPVVLLIAGSGPTDRDGNSAMLKAKINYFLQISDALKLKNIAVLRYDKRDVGQSRGNKPVTTVVFDDMVDDAVAMIRMLKGDSRFSKVIVAGHSEGSLVGMIACEREKADGFISLSGAGVPADLILKTQIKEGGAPASSYAKAVLIMDSIKAGQPVRQQLEPGFDTLFSPAIQPYMHSWMQYDPRIEIAKLTIPVLLVQGTTDIQVSVMNVEALKKAKPNAQLKLIAGMSHILKEGPVDRQQNAATYSDDKLQIHPQLIPVLADFVNSIK